MSSHRSRALHTRRCLMMITMRAVGGDGGDAGVRWLLGVSGR